MSRQTQAIFGSTLSGGVVEKSEDENECSRLQTGEHEGQN